MSLNFNTTVTNRHVDHGSGTSLDNLNPVTLWAWVYRNGNGANQEVITKDSTFPSGYFFLVDNVSGEGQIRFFRPQTGTDCDFVSAVGTVPLYVPMFIAATYDSSLATRVDLYTGTEVRPVTEVAYAATTSGTGTPESDASSSLFVGNLQRATSNPFKGLIGWYGVVNRLLTLGELEQIRSAPTIYDAWTSGTVLLSGWQDSAATQIDLSGYGNHGTVNGSATGGWVDRPLPRRAIRLPIVGRRAAAVSTARVYSYIIN